MKQASPAMQAHLASSTARLATALRVTAQDGTVIGFTSSTRPVVIDGVEYKAATGQTPTAVESTSSLSVDNLTIETIRDIDAVTGPDLLRGRWDFADLRMFLYCPDDVDAGIIRLRRGRTGQISISRQKFTSEVRGMMEAFTQQILDLYSPGCRVDLGDSRCGVPLDPPAWTPGTPYQAVHPFDAKIGATVRPTTPTRRHYRCVTPGMSGETEPAWNETIGELTDDGTVQWEAVQALTVAGTVAAVVSLKRTFTSDLVEPDDFFTGGLVVWLTGQNAGAGMEVKTYEQADGRLSLMLPLWQPIEPGDQFRVHAGCFKRVEDCRDKFRNTFNFRGEPYVAQNFEISPARIEQNAGGK